MPDARATVAVVLAVAIALLGAPAAHAEAPGPTPGSAALGARPAPPRPVVHAVASRYVEHVSTRDRVVFLTIDDGVVRDPAFLDLERRQHLPVTLFLTDSVLRGTHVEYFRALQAAGAVIENHTLTHPVLTKVAAPELRRQLCGTQQSFTALFGRTPVLMRPPYGVHNPAVIATALACGDRAVVGWDAVMPPTGRLQTWGGTGVLHSGDIVLMHFLTGLAQQVERLQRLVRGEHLRFALLENYV